jgi:hypothetical protein
MDMTNRISTVLSLLLLGGLWSGCTARKYDGNQRFPLSGEVLLDGQPTIDRGAISFIPLGGDKQRVSGGLIVDGKYQVPEEKGANAGKYRVEIRWAKKTGRILKDALTGEPYDERKEALPAKYHTNSDLTAEVAADKTVFDYKLDSK